jgi:hypothetical protein
VGVANRATRPSGSRARDRSGEALPADADTVAKSLPVAEYQVKISIGGIYNMTVPAVSPVA